MQIQPLWAIWWSWHSSMISWGTSVMSILRCSKSFMSVIRQKFARSSIISLAPVWDNTLLNSNFAVSRWAVGVPASLLHFILFPPYDLLLQLIARTSFFLHATHCRAGTPITVACNSQSSALSLNFYKNFCRWMPAMMTMRILVWRDRQRCI